MPRLLKHPHGDSLAYLGAVIIGPHLPPADVLLASKSLPHYASKSPSPPCKPCKQSGLCKPKYHPRTAPQVDKCGPGTWIWALIKAFTKTWQSC